MVNLKSWEEMTNAERAEQTFRDLRLRQERRRAGVRERSQEATLCTGIVL